MGEIFRYIDDSILPRYAETDESCPICGQATATYRFILDGESRYQYSESACVDCIRTVRLRYIRPKDNERDIPNIINHFCPKGTKSQSQRFALTFEICDEYRRTPLLPNFIQWDDWPWCCGDFTEYIGDAGITYSGPFEGFEWWGYENDGAIEYGIEGMIGGEIDERVSLFRCLTCPKRFWTFQCT